MLTWGIRRLRVSRIFYQPASLSPSGKAPGRRRDGGRRPAAGDEDRGECYQRQTAKVLHPFDTPKAAGYPAPRQILGKFHIYVADTPDAARREAAGYLEYYAKVSAAAPGRRRGNVPRERPTYDEQVAKGEVIAGDAQQCIRIIEHWREALGLTCISGTFHFGGMPHELGLKNIGMFAAQVIPAFD